MVIVWRLRGNIIRTALCWIMWHNVHSQQHTYMSSSYRSNRLGLSHWDSYAVHKGSCGLGLYYCNMVEWFWWDSSLISMTNWFPSVYFDTVGLVIWRVKIVPKMTYYVSSGTLNPTHSLTHLIVQRRSLIQIKLQKNLNTYRQKLNKTKLRFRCL